MGEKMAPDVEKLLQNINHSSLLRKERKQIKQRQRQEDRLKQQEKQQHRRQEDLERRCYIFLNSDHCCFDSEKVKKIMSELGQLPDCEKLQQLMKTIEIQKEKQREKEEHQRISRMEESERMERIRRMEEAERMEKNIGLLADRMICSQKQKDHQTEQEKDDTKRERWPRLSEWFSQNTYGPRPIEPLDLFSLEKCRFKVPTI